MRTQRRHLAGHGIAAATFVVCALNKARNGKADAIEIGNAAILMQDINRLTTKTAAIVRNVLTADDHKKTADDNPQQPKSTTYNH